MRQHVTKRISSMVEGGQDRVTAVASHTRDLIFSLLTMILTVVLIVLVAIFLYGTFYYAYMPIEVHEESVNLLFVPCRDSVGRMCSFPNASLTLDINRKHRLMTGQPYSISILMEVPDSTTNQGLGMFISCLKVRSADKKVVAQSCRSSILEFRSNLLRVIETLVFSPFLLLGTTTQRQWVRVNYFRDFVDDPESPAREVVLEIQSEFLQVYSTKIQMTAELTGLRHIMYHHPWVSTFTAVLSNILLLTTIILVSWTRFFTPEQRRQIDEEERRGREEIITSEDGELEAKDEKRKKGGEIENLSS